MGKEFGLTSLAQCFEERTEHHRVLQDYKNAVTGCKEVVLVPFVSPMYFVVVETIG